MYLLSIDKRLRLALQFTITLRNQTEFAKPAAVKRVEKKSKGRHLAQNGFWLKDILLT